MARRRRSTTFRVDKIIDVDNGYNNIVLELRKAAIQADLIAGVGLAEGKKKVNSEGHDLVKIGAINEYGAPNAGLGGMTSIPERPFMRTAFDKNYDKYYLMIKSGFQRLMKDRNGKVLKILKKVGITIERDIKSSLVNWSDPRNAQRTVKNKGHDDPLIEHGDLFRSVGHEVHHLDEKLSA